MYVRSRQRCCFCISPEQRRGRLYWFACRGSEEFVEIVEVHGFELARFHLLHQALQLREQGSTGQQREQQGHQQSSARGKPEDLKAAADEQGDPDEGAGIAEVDLGSPQGHQGESVLLPAIQFVLHLTAKGEAAEHTHQQTDARQQVGGLGQGHHLEQLLKLLGADLLRHRRRSQRAETLAVSSTISLES